MELFLAAWLASALAVSAPEPAQVLPPSDESVYVVQERAYVKRHHLEVTPIVFSTLNPTFVGYTGAALSVAYHVRENLALELNTSVPGLFYAYYSDMAWELHNFAQLGPQDVDLKQMDYFGALSLQFAALYGKLSFYDWLLDYDLYLSAGMGLARTLETCLPSQSGCSSEIGVGVGVRPPALFADRNKLAANLGLGMRFFFNDHMGLRLEVRDVAYADRRDTDAATSTDIRNNLLFFLGLSLMI